MQDSVILRSGFVQVSEPSQNEQCAFGDIQYEA